MNKVFLIGNLTRDPEKTETASGTTVCRFSIAVQRKYEGADGERKTDFFNCVAWRGLGESVAQYCRKGNKVAVAGSIELRNYEDRDGIKRTAIDIVAADVEFLTPRQTDEYEGEQRGQRRQPSDYVAPARQQSVFDSKPQLTPYDDDDDIPF